MAFEARALTGKLLGQRYLVGELSRETDVATQFDGLDTRTGCAISIDVVREGLGAGSHAAQMLEKDAASGSEIGHPNVVAPRDIGVLEDGSPFVITSRFGGATLEDRICLSGSLPVGDVVRIGLELLSALGAAHELALIHGDLRPESIFLVERDGIILRTLLSGFGRSVRETSRSPFGFASLAFLAPEVAAGDPPTVASDIYACAAILYLAATGFPPYSASSAYELCEVVREGSLRAPSAFRPELPARLVGVLVQALDTDPARRFASAHDMLQALELARGAQGSPCARARFIQDERRLNESVAASGTHDSRRAREERANDVTRVAGVERAWSRHDVVRSLRSLVDDFDGHEETVACADVRFGT